MRPLARLSDQALDLLQVDVVMVLLGLSIVALARAYRRAWEVWQPATEGTSRAALGALGAAAVARWLLAPKWVVTMYIGYHLTRQAIDLLPVSHYGVGSSAFYHALFAFLPLDHASLLWVNSVVGVLALPFVATFARRYLGDAKAGVAAAALVALAPIFIKNDNSDANHVPCLWWLYGAFVLWDEYLEGRDRSALAGSVVLFTLACTARPEMPLLLPVVLAVLTLGWWPRRAVWRDPAVYVAAAAMAVTLLPQVEHVVRQVDVLQMRSSLPAWGESRWRVITERFLHQNSLFDATLYPRALLGFAALALVAPGQRGRRLALAVAAVPSIAIYSLDLCRANMARVHVPGALLVTLLASAGVAWAWERLRVWPLRVALVALVAATAWPTAKTLWAPTNEQAEEDFLRAAVARLPEGRFTLVRIGHPDRIIIPGRAEYTHDHWPEYLVTPPSGDARVVAIKEWGEAPEWDAPAFFYEGTRCYARMRPPSVPRPHGDNLQDPCRAMHERYELEPVLVRAVPNRGDVWLEYYGDAPTLRLGLYRIRRRASAP